MRFERIPTAVALAVLALVAAPAAAQAHVTVQPDSAPGGGEVRLNVRVPNEMDNADTTKLQVKLPPGFAQASWQPVPGWTVHVTKSKLAHPIKTDDGEVTEQVSEITWTGHGRQGRIPPGAFQDFGLSVLVPGKAGDTLTFKALQTYSNGQVVRWIGPEGSDQPAPTVAVVSGHAGGAAPPATHTAAAASSAGSGGSDTLAIAALVVGALGLLAAVGALSIVRRGRPARA